jgi:hypothetical protein
MTTIETSLQSWATEGTWRCCKRNGREDGVALLEEESSLRKSLSAWVQSADSPCSLAADIAVKCSVSSPIL